MNELNWIEFLKKHSKHIGDDCAVIKQKDRYLLVGGDLFTQDVHFRLKSTPFSVIGKRAVARALSDIAACNGIPTYIGISIGVPVYVKKKHLLEIAKGVFSLCKEYNVKLIGGDTGGADKLFLDVWAIGETKKPLLRSTAKVGDYIFLSGALGSLPFNKAFAPKIREARYLAKNFKVNAMCDISDGLFIDLYRILSASKKGAELFKDALPCENDFSDTYRGEDYELLFTVDKNEKKLSSLIKKYFCIGRVKQKTYGYWLTSQDKRENVTLKGYLHF